jgi:hypothetical protein
LFSRAKPGTADFPTADTPNSADFDWDHEEFTKTQEMMDEIKDHVNGRYSSYFFTGSKAEVSPSHF